MNNNLIGVDIVENHRFHKNQTQIATRILTKQELKNFTSLSGETQRINFLASRWAAKEAIIKIIDKKLLMNEIEIAKDDNDRPYFMYDNQKISVSISHEKSYSVAVAIRASES